MTTGQAMFLLVAEEMSISRAAQRAFVTQQCASDHIKKLEETYGTPLFERRPRLRLTESGRLVLQTLRQTQRLEQMMLERLQEIQGGTFGQITLGLNPTRARIILPELLPRYNALFPNVDVLCVLGDTLELSDRLLSNKLDLFMGVNTVGHPDLHRQEIGRDRIFFLASEALCARCLPQKPLSRLKVEGITLAELSAFPMTRNLTASTLNHLINHSLDSRDVALASSYYMSDYDTQIALCGSGLTAAFCPALILNRVFEYNSCHAPQEQVHFFSVADMTDTLRIDLVSPAGVAQPRFMVAFIELFTARVEGLYRELGPSINR